MLGKFGKAKELYRLKRQADQMRKQMEGITVEVEERGVRLVMQGDQKVKQIWVDGEEEVRLKEAFNKAVKESQKKVARRMQGQLGDLGLPGLS